MTIELAVSSGTPFPVGVLSAGVESAVGTSELWEEGLLGTADLRFLARRAVRRRVLPLGKGLPGDVGRQPEAARQGQIGETAVELQLEKSGWGDDGGAGGWAPSGQQRSCRHTGRPVAHRHPLWTGREDAGWGVVSKRSLFARVFEVSEKTSPAKSTKGRRGLTDWSTPFGSAFVSEAGVDHCDHVLNQRFSL
jgi:hypothetical protein